MIEYLYPTPIYCCLVNEFESIQQEISRCMNKVDFQMKDSFGTTHYLSPTSFKENIFDKYRLKSLSKEIDKHLRLYCDDLRFPSHDYEITSWFAKYKKGNYANINGHGHTDISGVYYYKTNQKDGDLFFESPTPNLQTSKCYNKLGDSWDHTPIEGKLLLFPGWLRHGVRTNTTDNTRISISFNIYFADK